MGGDTDDEEVNSDDEVIIHNSRSEDPSTWKMDDELEVFTRLDEEDEDVGCWEDGVTFVKIDQVTRPGFVMVDDKTGDRTGWISIEYVRPAFSTPRLTDLADRRIKRRAAKSTAGQARLPASSTSAYWRRASIRRACTSHGCTS